MFSCGGDTTGAPALQGRTVRSFCFSFYCCITDALAQLSGGLVDSQSRKLLEAFEPIPSGPGLASIGLEDFGDLRLWRAVAQELVTRGWLRPAEQADRYARTEDGRLALAKPLDVTLYTRPGCHLCEEAKAQIGPLLQRGGARLHEINIDADPALRALYDYDVPVILLGARKVAKHRVDLEQFQRQLEEASRSERASGG
jgi:glutaredoxin